MEPSRCFERFEWVVPPVQAGARSTALSHLRTHALCLTKLPANYVGNRKHHGLDLHGNPCMTAWPVYGEQCWPHDAVLFGQGSPPLCIYHGCNKNCRLPKAVYPLCRCRAVMKEHKAPEKSDDSPSDQFVPLYFLDRNEIWETVKPYNFHYFPRENFPLHNLLRSPQTTRIGNMRSIIDELSLDLHGFEVQRLNTKMSYADFKDEALIENVYFRELEQHLKQKLGAREVRALDHQLRLTDEKFPYFGGAPHPKPQPSLMTHIDVTPAASEAIVEELYGDLAAPIIHARYQVITVWKPLTVPVTDWPLAICDSRSVDPEDLVATDVLYPNYVAENFMLHFNPLQKWYWLPDHEADEVFVFKAVDTGSKSFSACPHGAFPLAKEDSKPPTARRESIDVRLLAFYADMEYPEPQRWRAPHLD